MQKLRNMKKRSGFTLVELLIVIIIIGILAGAMMMLAGSGTDRAEATKIISDLRGLKAAGLMWIADNPGKIISGDTSVVFKKYMDRPIDPAKYTLTAVEADGISFIGRVLIDKQGVRDSLASNAKEIALMNTPTSSDVEYQGGTKAEAYMRIQ